MPAHAGLPILSARALAKSWGPVPVLRGVDLDLAPGSATVVLGENGAGKSTLLGCLAGDVRLDAGIVRIRDLDLAREPERARRHLVHVAQHPPLVPHLTPREHGAALAGFRGVDVARMDAALQQCAETLRFAAYLDRPIRALSGGTVHKVALALALASGVDVLLLDEPHAGLDVRSALALRGLLQAAQAEGRALLLASHLAEATLALADRALVLAHGRFALDLDANALAGFGGDVRAFEREVLAAMDRSGPANAEGATT
ncbi:MAG: ABC transporter ATP-binding protein [Myxococcales bacterium]|nr:ABC transporter ATP-binding protein [Myxococcales bacterium]